MSLCKAKLKNGEQCSRGAIIKEYCIMHYRRDFLNDNKILKKRREDGKYIYYE